MKLFHLKCVAISHFQSCTGSVFLHSLLDNHPQICSIPGVPNFLPLMYCKIESAEHALEIFEIANPLFYDTSKMTPLDDNNAGLFNLGENGDEGILTNRTLFIEYFNYHIEGQALSPGNVIISFFYAYSRAHGVDTENFRFILLHPHSTKIAFEFERIFPDSLHLIPIRQPMRAYCSEVKLRRQKEKSRGRAYSPRGQLLDISRNVIPYCKRNLAFCLFKIESLNPETQLKALNALSDALGVDYSPTLTESTFRNKPYWGANPSHKVKTFDARRHNSPISLRRYEMVLFSVISRRYLDAVGYEKVKLTAAEQLFSFFYIFLPLQDELNWLYSAFVRNAYRDMHFGPQLAPFARFKQLLGLCYDKMMILKMYFENLNSSHYDKIRSRLIKN